MEKWDVYDKDRNKQNQTIKAGTPLKTDQYRLVVHVCIFNDKNQMLIQKRHSSKSLYPGKWDVTVSGSVIANENSRSAGERELFEELGYKLSLENIRTSITFNFDEGFDDFYLLKQNLNLKELSLEKNEVTQVKWASQQEIFSMLDNNVFVPYHKSVIDLLFFNKDAMKIHTK